MTHVEPTLAAPMPPSSIDFAQVFAEHLIDLGARKVICWVNTQTWLADALNGEDPDA
jgi:hypothetical protein